MGKGQRTKGNTRPANSLRSAQLLSSTLGSAPINTFIGFDGLKESGDSSTIGSSNVGSLPDIEEEVDADFKLVIKQMYKKDSITKIKALQKFAEYCNEKDYNPVKSVLSMWPRVFNKLAIDNDFRVRETTFQAQEALVKKLGKNIAPVLKQIIAIWVISLHDTYAVSACAAKSSFSVSFSSSKQSEVLSFCKDEIINYCKDILLVQTITTIDDPGSVSTIDREAKYYRLVSCCLQALTLLINSLSQPEIIEEHISKLINHDNFWKLVKFEDLNVKVNWYRFKSMICEKYPTLIKTNEAKFVSSTLLQIAEKDQMLSGAIWDNVLWILVTVEEWWKNINLTKGFLPHLRKYIKEGGYGNASLIFPNLLPMLSKFPFDCLENSTKFCDDFIESFEICFLNSNHSVKEYTSIVKAYFECVQYLLIDRKDDKSLEKLDETICERIKNCTDQMLHKWADIYGYYFSELTVFITNSKNEHLSVSLIATIESKVLELIETCVADDRSKLEMLVKLLSSMLIISHDKSSRRVKFEEDDEDCVNSVGKISIKGMVFKDSLLKIWERLLNLSSTREIQTPWLNCLRSVQELCLTVNQESTSYYIGHNYLNQLKDLLEGQSKFTSVETRSYNYKHLINMLLNCCNPQNQSEIIFYLSSHDDFHVRNSLYESLPTRIEKDSFLQKWFTTPEVTQLLMSIVSAILGGLQNSDQQIAADPCHVNFLTFTFTIEDVHFPTINIIASLFSDSLASVSIDSDKSLIIVKIIAELFVQYPLAGDLDALPSLINQLALLSLNLNLSAESYSLIKSTLTSGLKVTLQSNDEPQISELFNNLAKLIKSKVIEENNTLEMSHRLESVTSLVVNIIANITLKSQADDLYGQSKLAYNFLINTIGDTDYYIEKVNSMGMKVFYSFWLHRIFFIPSGLTLTSEQLELDGQFIYTVFAITKILQIRPIPGELTMKQLPFIMYAFSLLNLAPIDAFSDLSIVPVLSDYITKEITKLRTEDLIILFKDIIDYIESKSLIGLVIGLDLLLSKSNSRLKNINILWKLEKFDYHSVMIFQTLSKYYNMEELISLSEETLRFLCNQEEPEKLQSNYGRLSILNTCLDSFPRSDSRLNHLIPTLMDYLITVKEKSEAAFLLECSLDDKPESTILFTIEVIKLYATIVKKYRQTLTPEQRDLIIISTTAWSLSLAASDLKSFTNPVKMILYCAYLKLFTLIQERIEGEGDSFSPIREWTDFHLIRIAGSLVPLIIHLSEFEFSGYQFQFLRLLSSTVSSIPVFNIAQLERELSKCYHKEKPITDLDEKVVLCPLPKEYESLFSKLSHLFINKYSPFYQCAHHLSQRLIPMMVSSCSVFDSTFDYLAPPKPFLSKLQETDLIVDTLLSDYSLGTTCCLIKPGTDSFSYTIAYLLNWIQTLTFFSQLNDENRSSLAVYLTDTGYITKLLNNLFKLMPIALDDQVSEDVNFIQNMLRGNFEIFGENCHIQGFACLVYFNILRKMPACVRTWLSKLDKRTSDLVNRFTTSTMSEAIFEEEFRTIQKADSDKFKSMKIKARHSAREVVAVYEIEEMSIELTLKLADNHPLSPVTIDGGRRVGVSVPEWRNWLLQVTSFLTYQNGSILDGLLLWNRNMSKKFEGLEECLICYFILHGSNCQVPKTTCRSCKKKFHSECLFKWFDKSLKLSCPLCRNPFDFYQSSRPGGTSDPSYQRHVQMRQMQLQRLQEAHRDEQEFHDFI